MSDTEAPPAKKARVVRQLAFTNASIKKYLSSFECSMAGTVPETVTEFAQRIFGHYIETTQVPFYAQDPEGELNLQITPSNKWWDYLIVETYQEHGMADPGKSERKEISARVAYAVQQALKQAALATKAEKKKIVSSARVEGYLFMLDPVSWYQE